MDSFLGEIRILAFGYAPQDWAQCNGELIPVQQNQALYSLIGNLYGGTPNQTFQLPNLQGLVPLGAGAGPGLTPRTLATSYGAPTVTLTESQTPAHTHQCTGALSQNTSMQSGPSAQAYLSHGFDQTTTPALAIKTFVSGTPSTMLHPLTLTPYGGSQAHENRQPYLTLNFCISLSGTYPDFN